MRSTLRLLLAAVLLLPALAWAQVPPPPCYVIIDGDRAHPRWWPVIYRDGVGAGLAYWCRVDDKWEAVLRFEAYSVIGNDYHVRANAEAAAVFSASDPRAAAEAAHKRLVTGQVYANCDAVPAATRPVCVGLRAELLKYPPPAIVPAPPPPDVPLYAVKPNPNAADGSRPTALLDTNGADRVTTRRRVASGAACDCALLSAPSTGTDRWCHVGPEPREVALCAKQ